ncbi:MAG: phage tail sheath subtilisin-like domain-containing protein [Candidatus Paceibacterota bacterium]|jgi:hypothetical protein
MNVGGAYIAPSVTTETNFDPASVTVAGQLRPITVVAVGNEYKKISNYEMVRGSSPTVDNFIPQEDLAAYVTGSNRTFTVQYYPIVSGDGTGTISDNPTDIEVLVNGQSVSVDSLDGTSGTFILTEAPASGDTCVVSYYHNLTDTLTNDNVTTQATGTNVDFYVHFMPIVDGTGGGIPTADTGAVSAYVDGVRVAVSEVEPLNGVVTLSAAPASTSTVVISHYFNTYDNTADPLPVKNIIQVTKVGNTPGVIDYSSPTDYTIIDDWIHWGAAKKIEAGDHGGTEYFDDTYLSCVLIDDRIFGELIGTGDGVETDFESDYIPVNGGGYDRTTNSPSGVGAYVGATFATAAGVTPKYVRGDTKTISLQTAPALGEFAWLTYYRNRLMDDTYTFTVVIPGIQGVGTYYVTSYLYGRLPSIELFAAAVADPGFLTEGVTWLSPLKTTPTYSISEIINITFTSATTFTVTSSVPTGSSGTGSLDQTYIDSTTGVSFTIGTPSAFAYAGGDFLQVEVDAVTGEFTVGVDNFQIPGCDVLVSDTTGLVADDECVLTTYDKAGSEPNVGDFYYVDATYEKPSTDYIPKVFFSPQSLVNEYGSLTMSNTIGILSNLTFMNGGTILIGYQIRKETGSTEASVQSYSDALTVLRKPVDGQYRPRAITVGTTNGTVQALVKDHCLLMSTKRWKQERVCVLGCPRSATVAECSSLARALKSNRVQLLYTGDLVFTLTDEYGVSVDYYVDASYMAAAYAGKANSPLIDWAEPMTRKEVVGFTRIENPITETEMDVLATNGITVIEYLPPVFRVRHSLTTDLSNAFTKEPSITNIVDRVQYVTREGLDKFIGTKFTSSRPAEVEDSLQNLLIGLVNEGTIDEVGTVTATRNSVEPDVINVVGYYKPIGALNYIDVVFNLRFTL